MKSRNAPGQVMRELGRLFSEGTYSGLAEGQILERFAMRREHAAFDVLLERHGPMVLGVCRRILRDPNDVDDAFQATFLVLVRKAGTIRDRGMIGPWLYSVASKTALRARANARRFTRVVDELQALDALGASPLDGSEALSELEDRGILDQEIGKLPEKYRAPIVLCYFQGLSHDEAAARLRWPVGTVRGRLARARDRLRDRLLKRGVTLASGLTVAGLLSSQAHAKAPLVGAALVEATRRAVLSGAQAGLGFAPPMSLAGFGSLLSNHVLRGLSMLKFASVASALALGGAITSGIIAERSQDPGGPPPIPGEPVADAAAPAAPTPTAFADPVGAASLPPSAPLAPTADPAQVPAPPGNAPTPVATPAPAAAFAPSTPAPPGFPGGPPTVSLPAGTPAPSPAPDAYAPAALPAPVAFPSPGGVGVPSANPNLPASLLENTPRELDVAIQQLAARQRALAMELEKVTSQLARLKQIRQAFDAPVPDGRGAPKMKGEDTPTPALVPNSLPPANVLLPSPAANPINEVVPFLAGMPPGRGERLPTPESRPDAKEPLFEQTDSAADVNARLNRLIDSLSQLQAEVESLRARQVEPRAEDAGR